MKQKYFCSVSGCQWNQEFFEIIKTPLCTFYQQKPKYLKSLSQKCTVLKEVLCQSHYLQKIVTGAICQGCHKQHDYEQLIPQSLERYKEKREKIIQDDQMVDREISYLNGYLMAELKSQQGILKSQKQGIISQMSIQRPLIQKYQIKKEQSFSLKEVFQIENIPNIYLYSAKSNDNLIIENQYCEQDKRALENQGITLLLKRYAKINEKIELATNQDK